MEKRPAISDGSSYLPEDLIFNEIFPKLPAKSLHRFQSVSKRSRSLTSHPPFLDAFRRLAGGRYVLSFQTAVDMETVFYYSDPEHQSKIAGNHSEPTHYTYIEFINGLVCLVERNQAITIRNAATKQLFHLPQFRYNIYRPRKSFTYFCHDPGSNKYKVLRTTCVGTRGIDGGGFRVVEMEFSIFSVGVDKYWRNFSHPDLYQLGNSKSVCINGVVFCTNFSTSRRIEDGVMAAFVVGSERFSIVRYPDQLSGSRYSSCHVIDVGGSIGVVDGHDIRSCGIIRLWIKGLVSESWVERRIEIPSPLQVKFNICPSLSFSSNVAGEMVVAMAGMSTNECHVYCHCVETGRWRGVAMVGVEVQSIFGHFQIDEYVENPLLLPHILINSN